MIIRKRLVVQTLLLLLLGVHSVFAQGNATWFLAEGANNATFTQEIEVGNPSAQALEVTVTLLPQADAVVSVLTRTFVMPATSRLTVRPGPDFGLNGAGSARVTAVVQGTATPADIVVERTMGFRGATHNASGVRADGLAATWLLAEGATQPLRPGEEFLGFDTFVLVANPHPTPTDVRATYLTSTGETLTSTQTAPPQSRVTFWPRAEHERLREAEFSTVIDSLTAGNLVVAERAMYFDNFRAGHDALGVTAASPTWYFAEGFTGGNATTAFETFLLLVNPGATATTATVDYLLDSGALISRTYPLAPRTRFTVWVDQEGRTVDSRLAASAFGMRVTAPVPIVAERAMYWGTPSLHNPTEPAGAWRDGHATAGMPTPATAWAFAEGQQGTVGGAASRSDTFFLLANPQPVPVAVQATFVREDGTGIVRTVCVAAQSRANVWTAQYPELQGQRFATFLASVAGADPACPAVANTRFVAERAVYTGSDFQAGHVNVGTPWTGPIATPLAVDPGPVGDLTVEGVDSNQNSVRDDVERYIALDSGASPAEQLAMTDAAIAMQESLGRNDSPPPTQAEAVDLATEVMRTMDCVQAVDGGGRRAAELVAEVLDTPGRSESYIGLNSQVAGQVFPAGDSSDLSSCSSAVVQALPAALRAALLLKSTTDHDMPAVALAAGSANAAPLPVGWTQVGNAGTNTAADGDVALAPGLSSYQWVSTNGGVSGAGRLRTPTGQEEDGSFAQTPTFTVAAGDTLNFYFNYITTDGHEFTEYAWAGLFSGAGAGTFDRYLFTARTTTSGNTVPGFGLPGLGAGVTLTPPATAIIAGAPNFSPLGGDSGFCFGDGCGYTGWVRMTYTFTSAGTYSLGFGVTNADDDQYDSAFAIAGVAINDVPIEPVGPEQSATLLYLNGVSTTLDVARDSHRLALKSLKSALTAEERAQLDGGDVLFVGDRGLLSDLLKAAQLKGMNARDFWRTLRGLTPAPQWFQDRFVELASKYGAEIAQNVQLGHLERVRDRIRSGKRVIIVAHSQGNFFANRLMDLLTTTERQSARIVSVANPDTRVAGGGPYTTLQEDLVVNAVRAVRPTTLPANVTNHFDINLTDSNGWHGFTEAYMAASPSRDQVVSHMVSAFRGLVRPTQSVGSGVITVTMTWGSQPDVDLHVTEPNGSHVYYGSERGPSGLLDVDDTDGLGPEHYYVSSGTLETGTYAIGVNYYEGSGPETATIQVEAGGAAVRTFVVSLPFARGGGGDSSPVPVASIIVTRDPQTGAYSYTIR